MDDGKGDIPDDLERPAAARLRGAARRAPSPSRSTSQDENRAASHVLHERHHRQPEGRRLQPPHHVPAHDGGDDWPIRSAPASPTSILPVVPMFHANAWGLAHAAVAIRRRPRDARTRPVGPGDRRPDRRREGHGRRRRADDLDGGAARAEGPRHVAPAGDPVRRLGGAEGAVARRTASSSVCRSCRPGG